MKRCVLDGATLKGSVEIYRELAGVFAFPSYFGNNPDALWDALGEYHGEPVEVIWLGAPASPKGHGAEFDPILAVLRRAAAKGWLTLRSG